MKVATGYVDWDEIEGGLIPGLHLIAGRFCQGRTSFVMSLCARTMFEKPRAAAALYTPGARVEEAMLRLSAIRSGVGLTSLRKGNLSEWELLAVREAARSISGALFFADDTPRITLEELRDRTESLARDLQSRGRRLGLVVIDNFSDVGLGRDGSWDRRAAAFCRELAALGRRVECPVLMTANISRRAPNFVFDRLNSELSDLPGEGVVARWAETVVFLHNLDVEMAKRFDPERNIQIGFGKGVGTSGITFPVRFDKATGAFSPARGWRDDNTGEDPGDFAEEALEAIFF